MKINSNGNNYRKISNINKDNLKNKGIDNQDLKYKDLKKKSIFENIYKTLPLSLSDFYIHIDENWYSNENMQTPLLGPSLDFKNIDIN